MDEGYKCANKSAAVRAKVSSALGHTATQKAHDTPAVCAAVSPCGGVLVSSNPSTVGGGGGGAPAVGYSEYSQWVLYILTYCEYSHVLTRDCEYSHLRFSAVCSCRPTPRPSAAVVPAHLRWGTRSA